MKIVNINRTPEISKPRTKKNFSISGFFKNIHWRKILKWTLRFGAVGVLAVALLFIYVSKDLPDPNKLASRTVPESTKIFDRNGGLLYEIHGEVKRTLVNMDQISPFLKDATVAVEDKDFYKHGGISVKGILRAVYRDIRHLEKREGGSTITQQLIKKTMFTDEKLFSRKVKEVILAIEINASYSKEDILKMYLNEIPYGRNSYGVEAAAQTYFNKHAKDLTLAESAYLAALPQAPSRYNPFGPNRKLLEDRKDFILQVMLEEGKITQAQKDEAQKEAVVFNEAKTGISAPHFVFYVQDILAEKYGEKTLQEGGLKVYTTLDPRLQTIAETAVKEGVEKSIKRNKNSNAALVAMDPKTGQILAMVGSKDYFGDPEPAGCTPGKNCQFEGNVNVSTAERQPGSSIKPLIYVTAFGKDYKMAPSTVLYDVVTNFGSFGGKSYIPHNYNGSQHGAIQMRNALAGSLNIPAVKTLALVGVDNAINTLRKSGYSTPLANCGLSLVLGGCEVTLVDHVGGYAMIAAGGVRHDKTAILKVEDRDGRILEEYTDKQEQVLDPQAAYLVTHVMSDDSARSFVFGAGSALTLKGRPVAAKTGTTQSWKDGWAMGFTPSLVAGVWTGNNDSTVMRQGADGVVVAAPIWNQFMREALKDTPIEQFKEPDGIRHVDVDKLSGKLPTQYSGEIVKGIFASYSVPSEEDDVHKPVAIDTRTGLPATGDTPQEYLETKIYTVVHSEKPKVSSWEDPVIAWAQTQGYNNLPDGAGNIPSPNPNGDGNPEVSIISPVDNSFITSSSFTVSVSAISPNKIQQVSLLIDGEIYQTATKEPYSFLVNKKLSDGTHTIAVKALDFAGKNAEESIQITISTSQPFSIQEPSNGEVLDFPVQITAIAGQSLQGVNFYIQQGSKTTLIGSAESFNSGGRYEYTLLWTETPKKGTYKLFGSSGDGLQTQKITIIAP